MPNNVVLIGPMGVGKSTVGRQLANRLNYEFLDTDHLIECRAGADIPWIFDREGEEGFRARETAVLDEVVDCEKAVIATGGGIVLKDINRVMLKRAGLIIYLTASVDQLIQRTFKDKKRPLLQVANPEQRIRELVELRDPIYRQVADRVIVSQGGSAKSVVKAIADIILK